MTGHDLFSLIDFVIAILSVFSPWILARFHSKDVMDEHYKDHIFLLYYLVISVGIQGIGSGLWQTFEPTLVAGFLQWPLSPFLVELGMANIAFGILGVISPWMDSGWRSATAVGYASFLLLTGILHIVRIIQYGFSYGDAGSFLFSDILVAIILFVLVYRLNRATSDRR